MRLRWRLALMLVAFVASAAAVVPVVLLLIVLTSPPGQALPDRVIIEYAFVAFVLVAALAFFPAVLVVAVAEWKRIRHWSYFTAAGALVALVLLLLLGFFLGFNENEADFGPRLLVSAFLFVAGLVAGLVYWLIAGRKSGALRDAWPARGVA